MGYIDQIFRRPEDDVFVVAEPRHGIAGLQYIGSVPYRLDFPNRAVDSAHYVSRAELRRALADKQIELERSLAITGDILESLDPRKMKKQTDRAES